MQALSYGFLLPSTGDKGSALFSALAQNITQVNNHTHDGVNSALIPAYALLSVQANLPASGWTSYGGPIGDYRQLVTMAPGYNFDQDNMSFRNDAGEYCYLKVQRVSPTSYYVYSNDPTLVLNVNYGG